MFFFSVIEVAFKLVKLTELYRINPYMVKKIILLENTLAMPKYFLLNKLIPIESVAQVNYQYFPKH